MITENFQQNFSKNNLGREMMRIERIIIKNIHI